MKERRVRFTETAEQHVDRERTWWRANRDYQDVFAEELESAVKLLGFLPGIGTSYQHGSAAEMRRFYIRKVDCHLYYTFDEDEVIVWALWGARRERGPRL